MLVLNELKRSQQQMTQRSVHVHCRKYVARPATATTCFTTPPSVTFISQSVKSHARHWISKMVAGFSFCSLHASSNLTHWTLTLMTQQQVTDALLTQVTLSKLITYCLLMPTQPPILSRTDDKYTSLPTVGYAWRPSAADWWYYICWLQVTQVSWWNSKRLQENLWRLR